MDCMRIFCNDQQVDLQLRLLILEKLKKSIKNMKDEDLMLLLVYKTNAILSSCNRFNNRIELVDSTSIQTESDRLELIFKFIQLSHEQQDYLAVINLLKIWPIFVNFEKSPWNIVLIKMIQNKVSFVENVKELNAINMLTENDLILIQQELETNETWQDNEFLKISYLKLCLAFKSKKLTKNFMDTIHIDCFKSTEIEKLNHEYDEPSESLQAILSDKELMNLLIEDNFYCFIMNTPLYLIFTYYLLRNETKHVIYDVIRHLKQKENFTTESAKLLIDANQFFNSYKTLSTSLILLDKTFD